MKNVTYKVFVALMNGLCEGLGCIIDQNCILSPATKNMPARKPMTYWLRTSFTWGSSELGYNVYCDIYQVILEMETGKGIDIQRAYKKNKSIKRNK